MTININKQKSKKFVFVYLSIKSGHYGVQHGVAFLVPIIKKHGFEVKIITMLEEESNEEFKQKILNEKPDIIGFSCVSMQFKYLIKYSKLICGIISVKHSTIVECTISQVHNNIVEYLILIFHNYCGMYQFSYSPFVEYLILYHTNEILKCFENIPN